jgi:hypothetical protein
LFFHSMGSLIIACISVYLYKTPVDQLCGWLEGKDILHKTR